MDQSPNIIKTADVFQRNGGQSDAQILEERAVILAQDAVGSNESDKDDLVYIVEFLISNQPYAFYLTALREVHPLRDVTIIPWVPDHIVGVINLRGQVITVLDLKQVLGLVEARPRVFNKVIVAESRGISMAFLVDEVVGTRAVAIADIYERTFTLPGLIHNYLSGVTEDGVIVIDASKIISDERLVVR